MTCFFFALAGCPHGGFCSEMELPGTAWVQTRTLNFRLIAIRHRKIERFIQTVESLPEAVTKFDAGNWSALVSTMTVHSKRHFTFLLTSGIEVEIEF